MKGRIKEISYKRVFNLGNFETEHIAMTMEPYEGEDPDDVLAEIKDWVFRMYEKQ